VTRADVDPAPASASDRKPRRGDLLDVRVEGFDARGRACGSSGEFRARLRRGVPGELVRARVIRRRRDLVDAIALERLEASPIAVPARCAHFGACGGCRLQDVAYAAQLEGKRRLVEAALASRGLAGRAEVEPVRPAPLLYGYRNKMEFSFGSRRWIDPTEPAGATSSFALGLHAAELFDKVVDVRACAIQPPAADAILSAAREIALERALEPWDARAHTGLLRHLVVRTARATGGILVGIVTSREAEAEIGGFADALLARGLGITTLVHGVNSRPADTAIAERVRVLFGPGFLVEELGGLRFELSYSSFFQTNTAAAEVLVSIVREEASVAATDVVWDLYCGIGMLALSLAGSAREVVGFEVVPSAVADARRNAERNGIPNARFVEGDVVPGLEAAKGSPPPDLLLLDPPRSGLHPKVFEAIDPLPARRLVYVSCNPAAAARDVERLCASGWRAGRVRPVDLFPHTPHVECVVGLSR
jgi:23S rRNA (uracil1939-C5)-methyltransferase